MCADETGTVKQVDTTPLSVSVGRAANTPDPSILAPLLRETIPTPPDMSPRRVAAARTVWESITAAVGTGPRPSDEAKL
jgi:hypothetical protein